MYVSVENTGAMTPHPFREKLEVVTVMHLQTTLLIQVTFFIVQHVQAKAQTNNKSPFA